MNVDVIKQDNQRDTMVMVLSLRVGFRQMFVAKICIEVGKTWIATTIFVQS